MQKRSVVLVLVVLLLGISLPTFAQRFTANVRGQVTDPSEAAIPGVTVTIRNTETGLTRTMYTNDAGNYSFSALPVGQYELTVELDGFKTAIVSAIELNVADVREIGVKLEIGAVTDEITTTAATVPVETIGGDVAGLVSGEQIRELPLNGRNFVQLTALMPGVSTPDGIDFTNKGLLSGVDMSVSGSSVTGNQWAVDGANNKDYGAGRTILVYPSIEAIEEFKIHRNSYGPEFGGAGGAQVNLVTKGGTNRFQGSTFLFYRNDSLSSKNYFLEQADQPKDELDRKDFGFTLGGPIVKDKLHFFLSTEWNDETRGTVRAFVVPTAAERAGDFSQRVEGCSGAIPIDPLTGEPFPGNIIPEDRLSAAGLAMMQLYPLPNVNPTPGSCNNWVTSVPTAIDWSQINGRLDWSASDKTRVLLRYTTDTWKNPAPNASDSNGLWGDDPFPAVDTTWDQPGDSLVAQLNQVLGSSIVNSVTFSMSGNEINLVRGGDNPGLNAEINSLVPTFFPEDGKTGGDERSHPVYWGGATGRDLWNIAPWQNQQDLIVLKDDYEQVFGNHWVKAGVLYSDNHKEEACCGSSAFETPHFWGGTGIGGWGATSGNRIADILIDGMYHGYDESAFQPSPDIEWKDIEVYIGDSWKVNGNLTVDAGLRYSRFVEPTAADDNIAAFVPELFDPALGQDACNGVAQVPGTDPCGAAGLLGGTDGVSDSFVKDDTDNIAPRLGLAWDVFSTGKSVLRAGLGQFYQRERVNVQLDFGGQPPFTRNTGGARPLDYPSWEWLGQGFGTPNRGIDPNNETPYNWQYNLTWEQQLGRESKIEVSYVGNRGYHLPRKVDINQIPSGDNNGNGVSDRLDFVRSGGGGDGSLRPYFQGGDRRILYWINDGRSEYDSLQTQLTSRFGRGSHVQVSYTWSSFKANDSMVSTSAGEEPSQITDWNNPDLDWGHAEAHRDHVLNASLVWNLPTFEGQGGFKEHVLGNWTIGSVMGYASGSALTIYVEDIAGIPEGGYAGTGYDANNRPIRVAGVGCGGGGGTQIINPDAFTLVGLQLGDTSQMAPRGACEGPDFFQLDLSFYKNLDFGDRVSAQFRIEIFNLTNEANFVAGSVENVMRPFNVTYDTPDLANATTITGYELPGNFGQASATRAPRQVQFGFKLLF